MTGSVTCEEAGGCVESGRLSREPCSKWLGSNRVTYSCCCWLMRHVARAATCAKLPGHETARSNYQVPYLSPPLEERKPYNHSCRDGFCASSTLSRTLWTVSVSYYSTRASEFLAMVNLKPISRHNTWSSASVRALRWKVSVFAACSSCNPFFST